MWRSCGSVYKYDKLNKRPPRLERHALARLRMGQRERRRVQAQAAALECRRRVERVADDGVPRREAVDAELVRPAREWL